MLNLLQKIFKTRSCENYFFSIRKKPCLQYQINRCTAPCVDLISQDDYQETIHNSVLFLQGKNDSLINKYDKQMIGKQMLLFDLAKKNSMNFISLMNACC